MAEKKIFIIILEVDLECTRCYKKISKTICKIQEKENIQTIVFDEKTNTVTISGPFDPKKVIKKLCCDACKVIKDIQVKEKGEKPKPAAEPAKDKDKDKAKPAAEPAKDKDKAKDAKPAAEPAKDKPKDVKPAAEPAKDKPKDDKPKDKPKDAKPAADELKKDKPKDAEPAKDKPKDTEPQKDKPKALESFPPAPEPGFFAVHEPRFDYQPVWGGPVCACGGRQYDGYYGVNRGCWCGRGYGWGQGGPMGPSGPPPVVYGQPVYGGYKTQNYFCEENPESCSIM